jgi:hypothetical protein
MRLLTDWPSNALLMQMIDYLSKTTKFLNLVQTPVPPQRILIKTLIVVLYRSMRIASHKDSLNVDFVRIFLRSLLINCLRYSRDSVDSAAIRYIMEPGNKADVLVQ